MDPSNNNSEINNSITTYVAKLQKWSSTNIQFYALKKKIGSQDTHEPENFSIHY